MEKRYIRQLGMELSPLGFGIMRLPMSGETFPGEVYDLIDLAMEEGVNYYDTAYLYQKGKSEALVREALVKRYDRGRFYIADKLPVWECKSQEDMERIFRIQQERLGVEQIDFYLLHGLYRDVWEAVHEKGVLDFLDRKKREGKIRKAGFSFHDTIEVLKTIEQAYEWDFVQLQINYYDWEAIHVKECYEYLEERDIPCMVMEPVGGGRLSSLPEEAERVLKEVHPDRSAASWAIQYVASLPDVAVILSGMNKQEQLWDNIDRLSEIRELTEEEKRAIKKVVGILHSYQTIPCTGCGYCMDGCPAGVDIPQIFKRYNDSCLFENMTAFDADYFMFLPEKRRGDACIQCGKCSARCPQKIKVPEEINRVHRYAIGLSLGVEEGGLDGLMERCRGKKIICFGAGLRGIRGKAFLEGEGLEVAYFCDNDKAKWGTEAEGTEVVSPEKLGEIYAGGDVCVLVTSMYQREIREQLKSMGIDVC